jgi:hypothetical protein
MEMMYKRYLHMLLMVHTTIDNHANQIQMQSNNSGIDPPHFEHLKATTFIYTLCVAVVKEPRRVETNSQ